MPNLKVQEYISISGRYHTFQPVYDNIRSALIVMDARARNYAKAHNTPHTVISTDNKTFIRVTHQSGYREFTLVMRRKDTPVPFGHLIRKEVTNA